MANNPAQNLFSSLLNIIYPNNCILCKTPTHDRKIIICKSCQSGIQLNFPVFCTRCSRHLEHPEKSPLCPQCTKHTPSFDQAISATMYNNTMKRLIHLFKYKNKTSLKKFLCDLISHFIQTYRFDLNSFDFIVAVPLHPSKFRERQYNQSQVLAGELSRRFGIPELKNNLLRCRTTKTQALLHEKERWTNMNDAFRIRRPSEILKKKILVVDDLLTTGATACEAARACKQAGANFVGILTLSIA